MDRRQRTWRDLDNTLSGQRQTLGNLGSTVEKDVYSISERDKTGSAREWTVKKTRENWMKPWTGLHQTGVRPQKATMTP